MKYINDCIDAGFGYENNDGYVRILDKPRPSDGKLVMRHRWFWETYVGPIPDGYEINHLCKNRRCFNLDHLECIPGSEHAVKSNKERYKEMLITFSYRYHFGDLKEMGVKEISEVLGRPRSTVKKWVAKVRNDNADIH